MINPEGIPDNLIDDEEETDPITKAVEEGEVSFDGDTGEPEELDFEKAA